MAKKKTFIQSTWSLSRVRKLRQRKSPVPWETIGWMFGISSDCAKKRYSRAMKSLGRA